MGALVLAVHAVAPGGIGSIPSGAAVAALGRSRPSKGGGGAPCYGHRQAEHPGAMNEPAYSPSGGVLGAAGR